MKKWKLKSERKMEQQKKSNINSIAIMVSITVIVVGLFGIILILNKGKSSTSSPNQTISETSENNVTIQDGKQVIEIIAKGGYSPKKSVAKAGVPTVIKFKTNGTYDCSSALNIPSLKISKNLPGTGETEIEIGSQEAGKLTGNCSMGMYFFEIDFQA
jgi:plastocyanin domain-containing protein